MLKKLIVAVLLVISSFSLGGCEDNTELDSYDRVLTGMATFDWHIPVNTFDVIVEVKLSKDVIYSVEINEACYAETGDYGIWTLCVDDFLDQFVGLKVSEVSSFVINAPVDPTNKDDVGSLTGSVDVIATATASSLAVVKAILNAVEKY